MGGNEPKTGQKKPAVTAETERLKALLIEVIRRLAKYEPEALDMLKRVMPADPNDSLDDLGNSGSDDEKRVRKQRNPLWTKPRDSAAAVTVVAVVKGGA